MQEVAAEFSAQAFANFEKGENSSSFDINVNYAINILRISIIMLDTVIWCYYEPLAVKNDAVWKLLGGFDSCLQWGWHLGSTIAIDKFI